MAAIPTSQPRPFIPAPGIVQAEMVYKCQLQICENVYHFQLHADGTAPTLAEMTTLANNLEAWERAQMLGTRHLGTQLDHIVVRDLTTQSAPAIITMPATPAVGAVAANNIPASVTVAVKWSTALRGRSYRGRTFHIGLGADRILQNALATGVAAAFVAAYQRLYDGTGAVPASKLVVLSYAHNKFWRSTALATPVTAVSVDNNIDSQRRRLNTRGQ